MDKSKIYLDLIKLSEDQRKKIGILLRKHLEKIGFHTNVRLIEGIVFEDTFLYFNLSYKEWCLWHTKLENRTELTYPEFIKLFEGGEGEKNVNYYDSANRFIQSILDSDWLLDSEQQTKLTDLYINHRISEEF